MCYFCVLYKKGGLFLEILGRIIQLLNEKGIKQKELTNYLSLSHNVFTEWKAGRNNSYMKHLPKIAEFLGVSVDYLLGNYKHKNTEELELIYALYGELTHDLTCEQIQQLKQFADFLRDRNK